jgi:hypothetical protein
MAMGRTRFEAHLGNLDMSNRTTSTPSLESAEAA